MHCNFSFKGCFILHLSTLKFEDSRINIFLWYSSLPSHGSSFKTLPINPILFGSSWICVSLTEYLVLHFSFLFISGEAWLNAYQLLFTAMLPNPPLRTQAVILQCITTKLDICTPLIFINSPLQNPLWRDVVFLLEHLPQLHGWQCWGFICSLEVLAVRT